MTHDDEHPAETEFETLRVEIARAIRAVCPSTIASQAEDIAHDVLLRLIEKGEGIVDRPAS